MNKGDLQLPKDKNDSKESSVRFKNGRFVFSGPVVSKVLSDFISKRENVFSFSQEIFKEFQKVKRKAGYVFNLTTKNGKLELLENFFKHQEFQTFIPNLLLIGNHVELRKDDDFTTSHKKDKEVLDYWKKTYPQKFKEKKCLETSIGNLYFVEHQKPKTISKKLKRSLSFVRHVIRKRKSHLQKVKNKNIGVRLSYRGKLQLLLPLKELILNEFSKNKQLSLMSLHGQMEFFGRTLESFPQISITTYRKFIYQECNLRFKKIAYVSKQADSNHNKKVRKFFCLLLIFLLFSKYQIIFVDSTAVTRDSGKQYAWGKRGRRYHFPMKTTNEFTHFYSSMSFQGMEVVQVSDRVLRNEDLEGYMKYLINRIKYKYKTSKLVVVLDNALSHHSEKIHKLFNQNNTILLFTASTSPFLNLVEYAFEFGKRNIRKNHFVER